MEKYEEKLWGKIDYLHEKSLSEQNKLNIFTDTIIKYHSCLINFYKSIESIKTINTDIISEKGNSLELSLKKLQCTLFAHMNEIKECANSIQTSIIDLLIKTKDDENKFNTEMELLNQYNKMKTIYQATKLNCDKIKKDFYSKAKFCENNIRNLIQYKSNILNNNDENKEEIIKAEEKMNISIANAKYLEEKYIRSIDEVNNAKDKMVKIEEDLLKLYQKINYDFYNKIYCIVIYITPILKKMFSTILLQLSSTEEKCKHLDLTNDINEFINNNKSNLSPEKNLEYEPYFPEADIDKSNSAGKDKKELDILDLNYNIIKILKENFKDIRKDIDIKEEEKKYRLRFLCNKIFKIGPGVSFKKEEKDELINLIQEPEYKSFFLITLSKQRTKGRFKRSEKLVKELVEILINILISSEKNNDFTSAKNCIILCETFYYEKEKNKKDEEPKKIYLIDYIRYYKWFQDINFWEGIIENMIQNEIIKNENINKKNNNKETPEEIKNRISNICFSIVLSYTNTMFEFNISKENINKIIDIFVQKYNVNEKNAKSIYDNAAETKLVEPEEENKKTFEEIYSKFL